MCLVKKHLNLVLATYIKENKALGSIKLLAKIKLWANFSNINLNDLFLFLNKTGVCNFADDTTPFVCHRSLAELLEKLESNSELVVHWFEDNYMKLNPAKCHLFMSGH